MANDKKTGEADAATLPPASLEKGADASTFKVNPDKADKTAVAQVEVLPDEK